MRDTWLRLVGPAMTWPSLRLRRPTWPEASGRALIYQLRATGSSNDSQGRRGPSRLPRRGVPSATCRQGEGGEGPGLSRCPPLSSSPPPEPVPDQRISARVQVLKSHEGACAWPSVSPAWRGSQVQPPVPLVWLSSAQGPDSTKLPQGKTEL